MSNNKKEVSLEITKLDSYLIEAVVGFFFASVVATAAFALTSDIPFVYQGF